MNYPTRAPPHPELFESREQNVLNGAFSNVCDRICFVYGGNNNENEISFRMWYFDFFEFFAMNLVQENQKSRSVLVFAVLTLLTGRGLAVEPGQEKKKREPIRGM